MPSNCFFVVIFFVGLAISGVHSAEVDCKGKNAENCDTTANIQEIDCQESDGVCTCKDENGACPGDWNPDDGTRGPSITYANLKLKCKEFCESENKLECRFYKYNERHGKNHCYFMNQEQCTEQAQNEECNPDHCESGYVLHDTNGDGTVDEECQGNTGGGGDDGIIVPDHPCPTGAKPEHSGSTMPDNYLRWECRDMMLENVNIYGEGNPIVGGAPAGTRCTTRPGCGEDEYVYKCNVDTGVWEKEKEPDTTPEDPIDQTNNYLKDVKCNAPDLLLDNTIYPQPGMEIQCVELGNGQVDTTTDPTQPKVNSQNNCLLLCDWFPVVNFYTKGNEWYYEDMEDDSSTPTKIEDPNDTSDIIYCW